MIFNELIMNKLTCHYNESIRCVEVLPEYLQKGIKMAKNYKCGLRITADFAGLFGQFESTSEEVILDFLPLQNYPDLPQLIIEDDFKISQTLNTEVLYTLQKLAILQVPITHKLRQNLQIDVGKIPNLTDLRFDFSPKIVGLNKAKKLTRLHIWSYKGKDLSEFSELVNLTDLLLVRPSIETLSGIENMTQLEKLEIAYAKKLTDISALDVLQKKHKIKYLGLPEKFF